MAEPKFTLPELTGSMADLGTIIPFILIAVSLTGIKLGPILLMFGLIAGILLYAAYLGYKKLRNHPTADETRDQGVFSSEKS